MMKIIEQNASLWLRSRWVPEASYIILLLMILGATRVAVAERVFGDEITASDPPYGMTYKGTYCSGQHCVAVQNDTVHLVWAEEGLRYARSLDGGLSFEASAGVDTGAVAGDAISLCLGPDGTIYAVWYDRREGDGSWYNIYFTKSTDGGESFDPVVRVDDSGTDPSWQTWPAVAADDSGRVYVVWLDERGNGGLGVYASRSIDGGASFDSSVALPNPLGDIPYPQEGPSIAARGDGEVYVACLDYVENGVGSWSAAVRRSTNAGRTYSDPVYVADHLNISVQATSIAPGGSTDVYIAWPDEYPCMARSNDRGQTFGPVVQVSDLPACCAPPTRRISVSAGVSGWIGVAWRNYLDTVAFSESRDGGASFLPPVLFDGAGNRGGGSAVFDGSLSVYFVWTDYRHGTKGDIYFSKGILDPAAGVAEGTHGELAENSRIWVWPNPFSNSTLIRAGACIESMSVYNLLGREVRQLVCVDGRVRWDGRDSHGLPVAPGLYTIRCDRSYAGAAVKVIVSR